jgi:hypothetical protein
MTIEVWNPRWPRSLQRLFNGRGAQAPLTVLDDVMPVVAVNDEDAQEAHFYRGETAWSLWIAVPAVAANFSTFGMTLGAQGVLAVVEKIVVSCAGALPITGSMKLDAGLTPTNSVPVIEGRVQLAGQGTAPVMYAVGQSGTGTLPGVATMGVNLAASGMAQLVDDSNAIVLVWPRGQSGLAQATSFTLIGGTVNLPFYVMASGYTRALDDGEERL